MRLVRLYQNSFARNVLNSTRRSKPEVPKVVSQERSMSYQAIAMQTNLKPITLSSVSRHGIHQDVSRQIVTITKSSTNDNISVPPQKTPTDKSTSSNPIETKTSNSTENFVITPACTNRIHQIAKGKKIPPSSLYLRIFVDAGGCSGFQYQFEIVTHEEEAIDPDEDVLFPVGETSVVVDKDSLEMMQGATVDYVSEMIRSGFQIVDNPMSETACGCGSSFAIKNFEANQ